VPTGGPLPVHLPPASRRPNPAPRGTSLCVASATSAAHRHSFTAHDLQHPPRRPAHEATTTTRTYTARPGRRGPAHHHLARHLHQPTSWPATPVSHPARLASQPGRTHSLARHRPHPVTNEPAPLISFPLHPTSPRLASALLHPPPHRAYPAPRQHGATATPRAAAAPTSPTRLA
jgi:hypothetical protein